MQPEVRAWMALARASVVKLPNNGRPVDAAIIAALAAWLGSKAALAAVQLPDSILELMTSAGVSLVAAETVGEMLLEKPMTGRTRHGAPTPTEGMTATRMVASEEPDMRAKYLWAAAKRLTDPEDWDAALHLERRYLDMHVEAGRRRRQAARRVDGIGTPVWAWRTKGDDRVTPDCAALEGRLFSRDNPPPQLPGAVHLRCRCWPEPFGSGPLLSWGVRP